MTSASDAKWAKAESEMPAELRLVLKQLKTDYEIASKIHVPKYTGGPNPGILSELISMGWRKSN